MSHHPIPLRLETCLPSSPLTSMSNSLRRRFEQNQEDCTFTVLALLPTATTNILEAMNTEKITYEIQQMKGSAAARAAKSIGSISPPSISEANATDDDGRSMVSLQSESGVHASQIAVPSPAAAAAAANNAGEGADTGEQTAQKPRRTKRQLWDDLTISCKSGYYCEKIVDIGVHELIGIRRWQQSPGHTP